MINDVLIDECWRGLIEVTDYLREASALQRDDRDCAFRSLTVNQARVVIAVHKLRSVEPDGSSLKTIAERLNISAAAASEMVDVLVRKDMLERKASENDRRAVCITLSKQAAKDVLEVETSLGAVFKNLIAGLPGEEAKQFSVLIRKLSDLTKN